MEGEGRKEGNKAGRKEIRQEGKRGMASEFKIIATAN